MPRSIIGFLMLALSFAVNGQDLPETQKFARLFGESQYQKLQDELGEIRKRDPASFAKHDFDYLTGRAAEKTGDLAVALESYQSVISRDSSLSPYALKHLSRIMRESGNLGLERLYLKEILFRSGKAIVKNVAYERLVRNYFESGDYKLLIDSIENGAPGISASVQPNNSRDLHVLLGRAYLETNQTNAAREVFEELIETAPDKRQPDDFSLEAVRGLDRIETGGSKISSVFNLTALEHKQRADIYQFNRDFEHAKLHYDAIVKNHVGNASIPEAMYQIARGLVQIRKYEEAATWFVRVGNEDRGHKLQAAALYGLAGVYANLDKTAESVSAYEKYISENPDASNIERGYLNIIDAYRDSGDFAKALEWCSKTQSAFKGEKGEAAGLFAEVRIRITAGKWNRALSALERLRDLEDLGGIRIAGGTNKDEVEFLRGLALLELNRIPEAVDVLLSIEDGRREYYGWRAPEKLRSNPETLKILEKRLIRLQAGRGIRGGEAAQQVRTQINRLSMILKPDSRSSNTGEFEKPEIPRFTEIDIGNASVAARRLLALGLFDEAAPALEMHLRDLKKIRGESLSDFDEDTAFTLATYYSKGGYADRAIRYLEPKWKKIRRSFPIYKIPLDQALILYPVPYRDALVRFGKEENVDPRFLLSIMRQESRFQADIKSVAAARGLMQFISNTSNKMAGELGIKRFAQNELYDPDMAIRFGAHYISNIFEDFPNKPQAVAASYNAGEDRMARWLKRARSDDPDEYVPEIIFSQTKDYVYKVMANYRMYQYLYDENLELRRSGK